METVDSNNAPRTVEQVGLRLLCRAALLMRGFAEGLFRDSDPYSVELHEKLVRWAEGELSDGLTMKESAMILTPPGHLSGQEMIDAFWAAENVVCLAWAIGKASIPAYGTQPAAGLLRDIVTVEMTLKEVTVGARLREQDEIIRESLAYEAIHWRVRSESLGRKRQRLEYLKKLMRRTHHLGLIPPLIEGDLAIHGRPCFKASPESIQEVLSISRERLLALNWLCGQTDDWDELTADTTVEWLWDSEEWEEVERSWFNKLFRGR